MRSGNFQILQWRARPTAFARWSNTKCYCPCPASNRFKEKATQIIAKSDNPALVAVRQDFSGPFSGRALLIFPEANSLELVRVVGTARLPLEDISSLEDEALAETGYLEQLGRDDRQSA